MIKRFSLRLLLLLLGSGLVLALSAAQPTGLHSGSESALVAPSAETATNAFHPVVPGPDDGRIAYTTAVLLMSQHYLHLKFDAAVSSRLLDQYLEVLDPQRVHFTKGDLAQFERYRTNLDRLTLNESRNADTGPACEIFNRFMERFQQHVAYVDELLKTEKFTFDSDERITVNRKTAPYPEDLAAAKQLWRERLRADYLQEKLSKAEAKNKPAAAQDKALETKPAKPKTEAEEIVETLSHRNHRNLRAFNELNGDDVLQIYLTTLAHAYDPHSDYFGRAQLESFSIGMNLSLFGIGAELRAEDGYCTISRVLPGGPAARSARFHDKDRIVAVAQSNQPPVDIVEMRLDRAVQLIRGPKGTEVRLTVIPAGADSSARMQVSLIRDEIKLEDQEAKARLIEVPNGHGGTQRLGVIDLPSFYASFDPTNVRGKPAEPKSTTADVEKLLTKLKQENVSGIILDLRRNGGGSLDEAVRLTGLFIRESVVVQVRDSSGSIEKESDPDPSVSYDGPLIVLTSRGSASASEILAGALQDYGRALIVGESSTHGKGSVQTVLPLSSIFTRVTKSPAPPNDAAGALKITIKKFYRPGGGSTQLKGVVPDIILPSVANEAKEIGETALENPLPWDTIKGASFEHWNMVTPYVQALRRSSARRLAKDPEFAYIHQDIDLFNKLQADKTLSLNEKQRIKEQEENDARLKARDKERSARPESAQKVYEFTLRQAGLPGLPPPLAKTNALAVASTQRGNRVSGATNAAAATHPAGPAGLNDNKLDEEKASQVDHTAEATLAETEHILLDYMSLVPKGNVAATAR